MLLLLLLGVAGCGNDFLGLEDYQRDILGVLIAHVGQQTATDGLNCWDFSGEGVCDADEDWNGPGGVPDEICDAWDCQGSPGEPGLEGPAGSVSQNEQSDCTTLCHGGETLVIAAPAVQSHLNHGDTCGLCD
jgi:hypothetical protein